MTQPRLWNPSRCGTLIVSDPRFGTHFLQRVIADRVMTHRSVERNDEIDLAPIQNWPRAVRDRLAELASRTAYQMAIVNSVTAKAELMAYPETMDNWHVIRLTRRDKIGWFRSWCMFFMHEDSEIQPGSGRLLHHGTASQTYLDSLVDRGPVVLTAQTVNQIGGNLSLHVLSHLVPVDEEIDYDQLADLESEHTRWKGNQYPEVGMQDMFANWVEIEPLLTKWNDMVMPGRFR